MSRAQAIPSMQRMKIMVVEDNPKVRRLIRYAINETCYAVIECADGADVLEAYAIHRPDLVLMDIQMPRLDGLSATKILKQRYPDAKIHILSDYDEDEMRFAAAIAGAAGYTSKIHIDELDSIVDQYLRND
jgi:CheY-like chemotaxis protein